MRRSIQFAVVLVVIGCSAAPARLLERQATDTLTAIEMDHGDTLQFHLRNGDCRTLIVEDTQAEILERNRGGIVYAFSADIRMDGHPMTLLRYVGTQESFYEPYVINGMRIWLDCVKAIFDKVPMRYPQTGNLRGRPRMDARFAIQDATLPICPEPMKPWYPNDTYFIDVGRCYNGDDCWLGAYLGQACHRGMDINHARGEPLWAPIGFDNQYNFDSLAAGDNNNRWRAIRRWASGDVWALQSHHHIRLLVPEHKPVPAGTHYAEAAGVHVGSHEHTHFEFKIAHGAADGSVDFDDTETEPAPGEQPQVIHLDPWIVFWQTFETAKQNEGLLQAVMEPLRPTRTGEAVQFRPKSLPEQETRFFWTFGDGGWSDEKAPTHIYARPGVYAVTLTTARDGKLDRSIQVLTVDGDPLDAPVLALDSVETLSFHRRPAHTMDIYGVSPRAVPHTLAFLARRSHPRPKAQVVQVKNLGAGVLPKPTVSAVEGNADWLEMAVSGNGNEQAVNVSVDAGALDPGRYAATVEIDCPGAVNSPQRFRIALTVPDKRPQDSSIVDDRDEGFSCTPYFWVGHKFSRCRERGYKGFYRTNGGRSQAGQVARFTPDLAAGTYEVSFRPETPFGEDASFRVRIRCASGDQTRRVRPYKSRVIDTFPFEQGTDGFVELHAAESTGLVIADAVEFARVPEAR